jgi:hypothetical protein
MAKLTTQCPGCAERLDVTRLTCPDCKMQLEGTFELPELLRLSREDLDFVLAFVRCSGSLKELGSVRGQSYPTVRNRLTEIIEKLSARDEKVDTKRRKILDAIAKGELSVKEATQKLKELGQ